MSFPGLLAEVNKCSFEVCSDLEKEIIAHNWKLVSHVSPAVRECFVGWKLVQHMGCELTSENLRPFSRLHELEAKK